MKTKTKFTITTAALALAAALALTACSIVPKPTADPTRYYVLAAPAKWRELPAPVEGSKMLPPLSAATAPVVGLRAVTLPAYLTGVKSIAVRQGRNEILYRDYDRWAEPLDDAIARIVRERLLATGTVSGVESLPGSPARTCDLTIRVLEAEGVLEPATPATAAHDAAAANAATTAATGAAAAAADTTTAASTTTANAAAANANATIRFTAEYELKTPEGASLTGTRTFTAPAAAWDGKDYAALAARLSAAVTALADDIAKNLPPAVVKP